MQRTYFHPHIDAETLESEIDRVRKERSFFSTQSTGKILHLLDAYGRALTSAEFAGVEGIAFLSLWLREKNLRRILDINFGTLSEALNRFVPFNNVQLRAAPRGMIAHWIAGNIPTLPLFSFAISALAKNANLVRVSQGCVAESELLISALANVRIENNGEALSGEDLLRASSFFHFSSHDEELNTSLSSRCDGRVIWGGADAVESILRLPRLEHAEDVVFGPKFSVVVVDDATLSNEQLQSEFVSALVRETIAFDQQACSSPQIVFVEADWSTAKHLAQRLDQEFSRVNEKRPNRSIPEWTASAIVTARSEYALIEERDVFASMDLGHTVFLDSGVQLSDGFQWRSLFVRTVPSLTNLAAIFSPKIQTVGIAIANESKKIEFCEMAAQRGVSRCVRLGSMNALDIPWDGMRVMDRLVRWVVLNA